MDKKCKQSYEGITTQKRKVEKFSTPNIDKKCYIKKQTPRTGKKHRTHSQFNNIQKNNTLSGT